MVQFARLFTGVLVRPQAKGFVISDLPDRNRIVLARSLRVVGESFCFVHIGTKNYCAQQSAIPVLAGAIHAPARMGSRSAFWIVLRPCNERPMAGICGLLKSSLDNAGRSHLSETIRL